MKLVYHLPHHLTYNHSTKTFSGLSLEEVVSYLKLIYKDVETFQQLFLSKIEFIPNLKNIEFELGKKFKNTNPLTTEEISNLKMQIYNIWLIFILKIHFPIRLKIIE